MKESNCNIIAFRVDSSYEIGTGHVMRCLNFADALNKNNCNCVFICRELDGNIIEIIKRKGFQVFSLPNTEEKPEEAKIHPAHIHWLRVTQETDAKETNKALEIIKPDWLIIDHYAIDHEWQKLLDIKKTKIIVIDDLADRKHKCDILIDTNPGRTENDYDNLVKKKTKKLLGLKYAILNSNFREKRKENKTTIKNKIVISMGGVDKNNYTAKAIRAIIELNKSSPSNTEVIIGPSYQHEKQLKKLLIDQKNFRIHKSVNNMAELLADCEIAIGAVGGSAWERCCLGIPSICVVIAENQKFAAIQLANNNAIVSVIDNNNLEKNIIMEIMKLKNDHKKLTEMKNSAKNLVDGEGIDRILMEMLIK